MATTRHWIITRLLSAAPLAPGQPLAALAGHCAGRIPHDAKPTAGKTKARGAHVVTHGLALTLQNDGVLAIACKAPCSLQVLSGQAWVTAEGKFNDIVVEPSSVFPLARGARYSVSPLHDSVTFVVAVADAASVQFAVTESEGARTLVVAPIASPWQRAMRVLQDRTAGVAAPLASPQTLRSPS